ncbi:two-component system chemotaxis response regulator CheY [Paenibacillus phyllosphaerae]|uniref:Two-component system chemotaxis response regulator CheY n=1 Tax=Paenibacillus phyllosphaerae TaxID=274593 RepID=A0A7W5AYK6_9BACL|nr:response regulator [Paenibacillus phyllosphaerae]MBB3111112.1 two-component system chemotaxis response regulator CheY [Paenibacillus phyllosphaerae]
MKKELTILICDDSVLIRKKLRGALEELGYADIHEAHDGEQAVAISLERHPQIVFMDIVMPVKTGIEALREIIAALPETKVVMASSVGTQSNLKEAIKAGAYDFIQKPLSQDAIARVMEKASAGGGA